MGIWLFLLMLVLLILVALLILVMASTVTIRVHLILRSKEYRMIVGIRMLYGMMNLRYEVPLRLAETGIKYKDKPLSADQSGEKHGPKKKLYNKGELRFSDYKQLFRATEGLKVWFLNTMSIVRLSDVSWSTSLALDNAAETAVAAGTVWGVKHTILGWLSFHLKLKTPPKLQVLPDFNGPPQCATDFSCIARISVGKAIFAGMGLILRVLKVKGGIRTWRNILFKA